MTIHDHETEFAARAIKGMILSRPLLQTKTVLDDAELILLTGRRHQAGNVLAVDIAAVVAHLPIGSALHAINSARKAVEAERRDARARNFINMITKRVAA